MRKYTYARNDAEAFTIFSVSRRTESLANNRAIMARCACVRDKVSGSVKHRHGTAVHSALNCTISASVLWKCCEANGKIGRPAQPPDSTAVKRISYVRDVYTHTHEIIHEVQ